MLIEGIRRIGGLEELVLENKAVGGKSMLERSLAARIPAKKLILLGR